MAFQLANEFACAGKLGTTAQNIIDRRSGTMIKFGHCQILFCQLAVRVLVYIKGTTSNLSRQNAQSLEIVCRKYELSVMGPNPFITW